MDLKAILQRIELFHGLNDKQIEQIIGIGREHTYAKDAQVFSQGSAGDAMYIIGTGQVEIQIDAGGGKTFSPVYLGAGQVFGEMALVDRGTRSASVVVVEDDTTIFRLPAEDLNALCASDTAIGYIVMRNLAQDISFKLRHQNLLATNK
jgi:glutaminase